MHVHVHCTVHSNYGIRATLAQAILVLTELSRGSRCCLFGRESGPILWRDPQAGLEGRWEGNKPIMLPTSNLCCLLYSAGGLSGLRFYQQLQCESPP